MFRKSILTLLILAPLAQAEEANRSSLMSVYTQVVAHNSEMAAARENYLARQEGVPQARAELLPQVALEADAGNRRSDRHNVEERSGSLYRLTLNQPLFDASRWFTFKAAQAESEQAELDFSAFQQQLILRTAEAYFNTLLTEDNLAATKAELRAFERQLRQTRQSFDAGLSDQNDVLSAQASFDRANANLIDSQRRSDDAYQALMRLTGQAQPPLIGIRHSLPVVAPVPNQVEPWVDQALSQNLRLRASQSQLKVAEQTLRSSKAEHLPTLNLALGYAEGDSDLMDNPSHFGQRAGNQRDSSVMVQFKLPIFSGGGTSSRVRQASHRLDQSEYDQTSLQREVVERSRNAFRAVNSDVEQVRARRQTIISSQGSLKATEAGYEVGNRNIVDILDAQRDLYNAVRDYNIARYGYILNGLRLKLEAGSLNPGDLQSLAQFLKPDYDPDKDFLPADLARQG
ncbi:MULTISPECIES: TolC family outer membrane protein [Pseudomonas]|uniref:Outer membrane protein n=1 Tax=Pseudomonas wadenswilerensis TaxID=1785161 RepID=A0A380T4C4_9PSED|nr:MULTISPECIES: TolC family outer membrane protein [Pseudomonas]UVM23480.1 TolC family outer membrane protein [Pseudomonas wadenswilerensis]SPO67750.1 Type I secretion outer membrane protein, TolC family [Pseudomonas sp. JV241A]SUQ64460.1 Outer membrane protein [Pseudomonas wadenswilerensis]